MVGGKRLEFWTELLRLPGYEVAHVEADAPRQRLFFTVVPQHAVGVCPRCGRAGDHVKQRRTREGLVDLPLGSRAVELKVRVDQFACQGCGGCFTPPVPFLAEGAHATERFLERAAALIRGSDVAAAARFFGVPERTLDAWYYAYVERCQARPATASGRETPIRRLGIDEVSLKKSTASSSR
jgi:transposase